MAINYGLHLKSFAFVFEATQFRLLYNLLIDAMHMYLFNSCLLIIITFRSTEESIYRVQLYLPAAPHRVRVLHGVGPGLSPGHQEEGGQVGREQDHPRRQGGQLPPEHRRQPGHRVQGGDHEEGGQVGGARPREGHQSLARPCGGAQEEERRSESQTDEREVCSDRTEEAGKQNDLW